MTTTSAARSNGHGSGTQRSPGGPSTVHAQSGVAASAAASAPAVSSVPPRPDRTSTRRRPPSAGAGSVPCAAVEARHRAHRMRLRAPRGAAGERLGPVGPRGEHGVRQAVGELVRRVAAVAGHAHDDDRHAHRAHRDGDLDGHVDDDQLPARHPAPRRRSGPSARAARDGAAAPSAACRPRSAPAASPASPSSSSSIHSPPHPPGRGRELRPVTRPAPRWAAMLAARVT